jgi:hypothetical protein
VALVSRTCHAAGHPVRGKHNCQETRCFVTERECRKLLGHSGSALPVDSWSARWAPRLIAPLENPADVISKLAAGIGELPLGGFPPPGDSRDELIADLRAGSLFLPAGSQSPWNDLVSGLETALR